MKYAVVYEKTDTGYSAYVPDLPGCVATASTRQKTAVLMHGAIEMHLAGMREDGDPIPKPKTVADYIEIGPATAKIRGKHGPERVRRSKRRQIA
jgi:predicted RNase H-like HicB family nuclease